MCEIAKSRLRDLAQAVVAVPPSERVEQRHKIAGGRAVADRLGAEVDGSAAREAYQSALLTPDQRRELGEVFESQTPGVEGD